MLVSEVEDNEKNIYLKKNYNKQIDEIIKFYQFKTNHRLKLIASKLDTYSKSFIIEKISIVLNKIKPNILYISFLLEMRILIIL